jgi:antitoxin ParD1/3/4
MEKQIIVELDENCENFIRNEIKLGRYDSVSEVICAALLLLKRSEQKLTDLRSALVLGEQSGRVEDFDPQRQLKSLHDQHAPNAESIT